jgi:2-polyprenyl-3-methyl-5-hydroxy-6-metoxy-1,4-benzoquinol methylase
MMRGRSFTDADARAAWNRGAEAWHHFVHSGADYYRLHVHGPALLRAAGDVSGARVLELGCGEGYFARELAGAGAHVVGIDISDEQLANAQSAEAKAPLGIEYRHMNAAEIAAHFPVASFDIVTACMALQDMLDVSAVLRGSRAVLRDGGRMVFSLPHPATDMPFREWERDERGNKVWLKVGRYFETGPALMQWNMRRLVYHWSTPFWRRTLEQWSDLIAHAGFAISRIHEPRPSEDDVARQPELSDARDLPYFLIFDLRVV